MKKFSPSNASAQQQYLCTQSSNNKLVCTAIDKPLVKTSTKQQAKTTRQQVLASQKAPIDTQEEEFTLPGQIDHLAQVLNKVKLVSAAHPEIYKRFKSLHAKTGNPKLLVSSSRKLVTAPGKISRQGKCNPKQGCKIPLTLTPRRTVIIDEPGYYVLQCKNLDYEVHPDGNIAVRILSDDVTIDLDGLTIRQSNPDTPFGYFIEAGYGYFPVTEEQLSFVAKNITIKNGTIKHFTGNGINMFNSTFGDANGENATTRTAWEDITIEDINVLECGFDSYEFSDLAGVSGISFIAVNTDALFGDIPNYGFKNIKMTNLKVNDIFAAGGSAVFISRGQNVYLKNMEANNTLGTNAQDVGGAYNIGGFYIEGQDIFLTNCRGNNTRDEGTTRFSFSSQVGSFFQRSFNVVLKDCTFNNLYGYNSVIVNVNTSGTAGLFVENCQFNHRSGGPGARIISGIHVSDGDFQVVPARGNKYLNCQFLGATADETNLRAELVTGYNGVTATSVEFDNCFFGNISFFTGDNNTLYRSAAAAINGVFGQDPTYPFANVSSTTFKNCTVSDIKGNVSIVGLSGISESFFRNRQPSLSNVIAEGNIISDLVSTSEDDFTVVVGIGNTSTYGGPRALFAFPQMTENFTVRNNEFSGIHHYPAGDRDVEPSSLVAAILLNAVTNAIVTENTINNCDNGIVTTGGEGSFASNAIQLASIDDNANAFPPIPVNLSNTSLTTITTNPDVLTITRVVIPNFVTPELYPIEPLTREATRTNPRNSCSTVDPISEQIAVVVDSGACDSVTKVLNVEAAGGEGTILIVQSGFEPTERAIGPLAGEQLTVIINATTGGALLLTAMAANPGLEVTIQTFPATLINLDKRNQTLAIAVQSVSEALFTLDQIDELGWELGDRIQYVAGTIPIGGLVNNQIYYLIIYNQIFTTGALIANNKINKSRNIGIRDDTPDCS